MNNRPFARPHFARIASASLLGGASFLSLVTAAQAQQVVFSSTPQIPVGTIEAGRDVALSGSTVQIKLSGGGMASFVGTAQFSIRPDGGIDLRSGSVTIVAGRGGEAVVHMPQGVRGTVASGGTGSFTANPGDSRGSTAAGMVSVTANGVTRPFGMGQFWVAAGTGAPDRVIAGTAAAVPGTDTSSIAGPVQPLRDGGIAAAAENGMPIAVGEALAGIGARGDIVAAARRLEAYDANPTIAAFPTGDYALLVQYAAQANGLAGAGGTPFDGAGADIIRTYFDYLAAGNSGPAFRTAYAGILLNYLDLVRSGVLPSSFRGATQTQLNAYLAFIGGTDGFGGLSDSNRELLDAYLAFLRTGGNPDAFGTGVTGLTTAFLAYVRGGGNPATFSQASASVVAQYLAIVNSGGLRTNLTAQNQALLAAYLANNGIGFTTSYATGLAAFVAYLNSGGLPSGYTALPPVTIRAYLETLETTGLFDSVLGGQSVFLRSYLSFLRTGGTPDQFNALPINVARVNASALSGYVDYLLSGGLPSGYTTLTAAQIRAALDQLTATGQFDALLGANAAFLGEYYAYLKTGADADTFAGLPSVDVNAYASALGLFATYLRGGNLPSGYTVLTAQQIRNYLTALQIGGKLALLGSDATLLGEYLLYLRTGGAPDQFAGLPIVTYQSYASALSLYFAHLNGGGLPSGYSALTQAQIRQYLDALKTSGQLAALLGANAAFFDTYLAYLTGGGAPDAFTGLPRTTYASYGTSIATFLAFLRGNGLPGGYTALTATQLREYLAVLTANGQLSLIGNQADIALINAYAAYLAGGGVPNQFTGLPAFVTYEAGLRTYYAFLLNGGAPSAYTALTQAQIVAYIQALDAAGLITSRLSAEEAAFLRGYATFVAGGGSADQFAGLPRNQVPTMPVVTQGLANAPRTAGALASGAIGKGFTSAVNTSGSVTINGTNLAAYQGAAIATAQDVSTIEARTVDNTIAIARWGAGTWRGETGGTRTILPNEGLHFVWGTPAFAMPTSGTATFGLITATSPTVEGGAVSPGTFTGNLGVDFATRRVGLDSRITMGGVVYGFGTPGGAANPTSTIALGASGTFTGSAATANVANSAGLINGFLSGSGGAYAGLIYSAILPIGTVEGSAIFGRNQGPITLPAITYTGTPAVTPNLTPPSYAYAAGLGTTSLYVRSIYPTATASGLTFQTGASVTRESTGALLTSSNASTQDIARLTARATDTFGDSRVVIGRWYDGTYRRGVTGNPADTLSASQSLHYVQMASPSLAIPTTGQIDYSLLAATQPTYNTGATGAGLFDGKMALLFGSAVKVALEGTIRMPEPSGTVTYAFSTPGGVAGVAGLSAQTFSNNVIGITAPLTGAGLACTTACQLNFSGGFAGSADFNRIGAVYYTSDSRSNAPSIEGAAIFTGTPAAAATMPAQPAYTYSGGFGTAANLLAYTEIDTPRFTQSNYATGANAAQVTVSSDGGVSAYSGASLGNNARSTAGQRDAAGDAAVLIGRWVGGTQTIRGTDLGFMADDATHYVLLAPSVQRAFATGTVQYTLLAATQPTFNAGGSGPGVFDAKLGITFGARPLAGVEGSIFMPETTGTVRYAFTTPGGAAAPSATIFGNIAAQFSFGAPITSGTGLACVTGSCTVNFTGGFGGDNTSRAGFLVTTGSTNAYPQIFAAAAFASTTVVPPPGGTATGTISGQTSYAYAGGSLIDQGVTTATYNNNVISGYASFLTGTAKAATGVQESGRLADTIGWARWTGDTAGPLNNQLPTAGVHVMSGTPTAVSTLPTSGTVAYTMVGGTKPTLTQSGPSGAVLASPGTMTGNLAVVYGTGLPRVAMDLTATVGSYGWRVQTPGGIANAAQSQMTLNAQGAFSQTLTKQIGVTPTTATSCTVTCTATIGGQLYGAGGSHIGLAFNMLDGSATSSGIAVFAKP